MDTTRKYVTVQAMMTPTRMINVYHDDQYDLINPQTCCSSRQMMQFNSCKTYYIALVSKTSRRLAHWCPFSNWVPTHYI